MGRDKARGAIAAAFLVLVTGGATATERAQDAMPVTRGIRAHDTVALPEPRRRGALSLEEVLAKRRSCREYREAAVTLGEIGQLAWAAQGVTHAGYRSAPSAGALYPLELYIVAGNAEGLPAGVYRYLPAGHRLKCMRTGELRADLAPAALGQDCVRAAAAVLVFAAVERRTTRKYGARGVRYIHIEIGHAAQNALLQAGALGLGAVVLGAFDDAAVKALLALPAEEEPLYLMAFGRTP